MQLSVHHTIDLTMFGIDRGALYPRRNKAKQKGDHCIRPCSPQPKEHALKSCEPIWPKLSASIRRRSLSQQMKKGVIKIDRNSRNEPMWLNLGALTIAAI